MRELLLKISELIATLCRIDTKLTNEMLGVSQFGIQIGVEGEAIATGYKGRFRIPYNGTIVGVTAIESSETPIVSSIEVDILKSAYDDYSATPTFTSITGGNFITIDGAVKGQDTTLTGWDKSVTAGTLFEWNVETVDGAEVVMIFIDIQRT